VFAHFYLFPSGRNFRRSDGDFGKNTVISVKFGDFGNSRYPQGPVIPFPIQACISNVNIEEYFRGGNSFQKERYNIVLVFYDGFIQISLCMCTAGMLFFISFSF
jgi:hypothetical protein